MKIRQGFVSNSSSASFVVVWQYNRDEDCYDTTSCLDEKDYALAEKEWNDKHKNDPVGAAIEALIQRPRGEELVESLIKKTKINAQGNLVTYDWTCMFNDYSNFGSDIKELMFCLYNENGLPRKIFQILDHRIESD